VASIDLPPTRSAARRRLRRIESVTDSALDHLAVEDLLIELLERVREVLDVDTAAVLLIDRATGDLVATAASGLEEEVRQGVRIPMGAGFAGRVAATAAPVVLDDLSEAEVHNPILRERGVRSALGAPLIIEGHVIGVIHVGTLTPRRFRDEDIDLLTKVASRVALAVEARRSNVERTAAVTLQRSLIPTRLPKVPGLDLAARYLPAHHGGVGGDWYDLFGLPSGHLAFAIGDVVGRGLAAAVVMGRLRSALRAYALEVVDPAVVLERLDRKLQHFEPGQMTTVLYCVLDPDLSGVELSCAGHPLPVLAPAGADCAPIDASVDPPLGVTADRRRTSTRLELPPGALLAVYTDGLVERRGELFDCGLERLCAAVAAQSAEESCRSVIASLVPETGWSDDAALVVMRRTAASK
jgi:putative methionine-R-sulfoxide reductase with GAF domain